MSCGASPKKKWPPQTLHPPPTFYTGPTPKSVLETTGVPVTGGLPMLMSKAVYYSWRSIYMDLYK